MREKNDANLLKIRVLQRRQMPVGTMELAKFLIGKIVVREIGKSRMSGRIVETEAYPPGDPAAHHFRGETRRNSAMFLRHGHAYVYFTYGNHFCMNVTAEEPGVGGGILLRALEPLEGIVRMQRNRGTDVLRDLLRGPGRVAQALEIDRRQDRTDLCARGELWLGERISPKPRCRTELGQSVRIGISKAAEKVWRFYEYGNEYVSGSRKLNETRGRKAKRKAIP